MTAAQREKTWFVIDGSLEPIAFDGPSFFRFPMELARWVVERFSEPGQVVLDPFCGFGTTVLAAEELGRIGVGIERDEVRAGFAAQRVSEPSRVVRGDAAEVPSLGLPIADLIFTSPPYSSFRDWRIDDFENYWADFEKLFLGFSKALSPSGRLVLEIANVREQDGTVRPLAHRAAGLLASHYRLVDDYVRCNSGSEEAAPGFDHSHLLVFSPVSR